MRILVMFDLPVVTYAGRKEYERFRKFLLKSGFLMMQESIYCKLAPNATAADSIIENVKKNKPDDGLVQVLRITEKQYARMECIVGNTSNGVLDTDERLVFL
ncbi:MAG: CRISPR-associated endonuclease Cas2 [Muricoprocola sp.]